MGMIYDFVAENQVQKYTSDFIKLIALFLLVYLYSFNKNYQKSKLNESIFYTFFAICLLTFILKEFRVAKASSMFITKITKDVDKSVSNIASSSEYLNAVLRNLYYTLTSTGVNLKQLLRL